MSKNTWLISDTHFGHSKILTFTDSNTGKLIRGDHFSSVTEMNEHMVERWNSVVKPNDTVYHLGDVFFGDRNEFYQLWNRLNGTKELIIGNHDDIKFLASGMFFSKVHMWKIIPDFNFLLSHIPLHESNLKIHYSEKYTEGDVGVTQKQFLNLHGHTHQNGSPDGPYLSTCVELRDYTPVHIEDLQKEARLLLNK